MKIIPNTLLQIERGESMIKEKQKILDICLKIYEKKKSLADADNFYVNNYNGDDFYFVREELWELAREKFFPNLTVSSVIDEMLDKYRNENWSKEWITEGYVRDEIPFTQSEWTEFQERFDRVLKSEPERQQQPKKELTTEDLDKVFGKPKGPHITIVRTK